MTRFIRPLQLFIVGLALAGAAAGFIPQNGESAEASPWRHITPMCYGCYE